LSAHLFPNRFHDLDGGRIDGRIHGVSPVGRLSLIGPRRDPLLPGRIAAELIAPQGEHYRFIAGLAGEIRMRHWRKIRFDASIRTEIATGVSRCDQTRYPYRRAAFRPRDGHVPEERHDA
ncbi:MAG: hypothetical protein ACRED3_13200, partial [Bradyrhizobium sp.]